MADQAPPSGAETVTPVYVMLPLGTISETNEVTDPDGLRTQLQLLKDAGVEGVMADCWWGRVQGAKSQEYNWDGYKALFSIVKEARLKIKATMSFHKCGGNVGDTVTISLPEWVNSIGDKNSDIYYKDRSGSPDDEYLSLGIDNEPALDGNTALEVYENYMRSFKSHMDEDYLKPGIISGIEVGLGPTGELRYPSYQQLKGWKYPNIGEFQCEDEYMKDSLATEGRAQGWDAAPQDAGTYNSKPEETLFFKNAGGYSTPYGKFFLSWYSGELIKHGRNVMEVAKKVFNDVEISAKVPGIHWYFNSPSHAAEATAGLFAGNPEDTLSVYKSITEMLKSVKATLNLTCAEMKDDSNNKTDEPQELVEQVLGVAQETEVSRACENALPIADKNASPEDELNSYNRIISVAIEHNISYFTFLRLDPDLMTDTARFELFKKFVEGMKEHTLIKQA